MPIPNIPEPLTFILDDVSSPLVISLVGAGGKTSALFWLAREFVRAGKRVVITTTTRMYLPEENLPVLICHQPDHLPTRAFFAPVVACYSGWDAVSGKVRGFTPEAIDRLAQRGIADVLLVEADGSRGFPLKAPNEHEPCIPTSSHCVIAVTGGQVLGHPVGPENVHRWPRFAALTRLKSGERLSVDALVSFICHREGMFKNVPSGALRIWLINRFSQFENLTDEALSSLLVNTRLDAIWLGAVRENPAILRTLLCSKLRPKPCPKLRPKSCPKNENH